MQVYKITFPQQMRMLSPLLLRIGIGVLLYIFIIGYNSIPFTAVVVIAIFFAIDILPGIIIYIQYYLVNRGATLTIDIHSKKLTYDTKKEKLSITFSQIIGIQLNAASSTGIYWNSFVHYKFCRISYHGGQSLVITNLMMPGMDKELFESLNITPETKSLFIPFLY